MKTHVTFWCKNCGGRVLEDETWEDQNSKRNIDFLCMICGQRKSVFMKDWIHLRQEILRVVKENKNSKRKILSATG